MKRGEPVEISGIWLRRSGEYVVVSAEVDGRWVEVIREHQDGPFSHIVEDNGIRTKAAIKDGRIEDVAQELERQKSIGWGRGMFIAGAAAGVTPARKSKG